MSTNPPFTVADKITNLVAGIAEQIGKIQGSGEYKRNLHLRRVNRLRSIQSSAAIEGNTLSLEQVTDVVNGKRVLGSPREVREVKNAYDAYEKMLKFNPFAVKDFLRAHKLMTTDLVKGAGKFRVKDVGVFKGNKAVHMGARPHLVPKLVQDLFGWAKKSDIHPLIKSSVVHFEIEFIHPFADGNGRMGRLWQTLILAQWHEIFAWIPVETIIHQRQKEYYRVLQAAGKAGDSAVFVEFMLKAISKALDELPVQKMSDILGDKVSDKLAKAEVAFLNSIIGFLKNNGVIDSYRAQLLTNKPPATVRRHLAALTKAGVLKAVGANKGRKYKLSPLLPLLER